MTLPLLSNTTLDAPIAMRGGAIVTVAEFVAQAEALANAIADARHVINLAENRYAFLLGWVAAALRGQVTLLPPNRLEGTLAELVRAFPGAHVFDDDTATPWMNLAVTPARVMPAWSLPEARHTATVFTSGTTGQPQPHEKTWGSFFHNSRLAARDVLGGTARNVVATVPSQHMYGLEASLLCALTAGCLVYDDKPFFPADVRAALAALPAPRTLVTAPAHLRVLAAANLEMPPIDRVVSATAPLAEELAREIEARWGTEVFEIYGCTEAGVMAHRRTTRSQRWRTLAGGTMASVAGGAEYRAPQLPQVVPLPDVIESFSDTEFTLRGRVGDMIKVAGKRSSLQELTRQILSVPGVDDAVVFVPDGEERLAAAVVAPDLAIAQLADALRGIMEPVFVPRPLVKVDAIPRNAVGKTPRDALVALLGPKTGATIRIEPDHPALAGHFPGNPLVPGVVLLDAVWAQVRERRPGVIASLPAVKFLAPVRPGETVDLAMEFSAKGARFTGRRDGTPVFEGSFVFAGESA